MLFYSCSHRENKKRDANAMSPIKFISGCVFLQGSEVLSQDGTLSIQEVSYDKAGEYMCVGAVPSVPGLTAQASVSLTVKGSTHALTYTMSTYTAYLSKTNETVFGPGKISAKSASAWLQPQSHTVICSNNKRWLLLGVCRGILSVRGRRLFL